MSCSIKSDLCAHDQHWLFMCPTFASPSRPNNPLRFYHRHFPSLSSLIPQNSNSHCTTGRFFESIVTLHSWPAYALPSHIYRYLQSASWALSPRPNNRGAVLPHSSAPSQLTSFLPPNFAFLSPSIPTYPLSSAHCIHPSLPLSVRSNVAHHGPRTSTRYRFSDH